jgi:hypothetical protein
MTAIEKVEGQVWDGSDLLRLAAIAAVFSGDESMASLN